MRKSSKEGSPTSYKTSTAVVQITYEYGLFNGIFNNLECVASKRAIVKNELEGWGSKRPWLRLRIVKAHLLNRSIHANITIGHQVLSRTKQLKCVIFNHNRFRQILILLEVFCMFRCNTLRGGTGKSLARPGRKQPTATKLGIYSSHSPRSSINVLACCSNFCKPLKKKVRRLTVQTGLRGSTDLRVGRKMANFQLCFQSREQVVVRRGQIRRMGWMIKTLENQVGQFLLGCKCPVGRGIVVQEQDPPGDLSAAFFLQNVFQLHQQRRVILRLDSLALWKMRRTLSWSQKIEARTCPADFCTPNFLGRGEPLRRHSTDCCFVSGS